MKSILNQLWVAMQRWGQAISFGDAYIGEGAAPSMPGDEKPTGENDRADKVDRWVNDLLLSNPPWWI